MKPRKLGVIGGLGPETGCKFCLEVNKKFKPLAGEQPHLILDNLPISLKAEERLIKGGPSKEHLKLLIESVQRLNLLKVEVIAIVCNTVHVFIQDLRERSSAPILSIIEETAKRCRELKLYKVGLLGSTKTINSKLHSLELEKGKVKVLTPSKNDQRFVSRCIIKIINHQAKERDKEKLKEIIKKMEKKGAEGIILGCTDLPLLLSNEDASVPLINTTQVLEDAAVRCLIDAKTS